MAALKGKYYDLSRAKAPFRIRLARAAGVREESARLQHSGPAPWVAHGTLGHGAFGAVFDATLRAAPRERVALKICFAGARHLGLEREVQVLAEIARRTGAVGAAGGLAELRTFFRYRNASALAMRKADATLSGLATALRGAAARFSEPVALFYAAGALDACAALHAAGFIHADVKPDNLCVHFGEPSDPGIRRSAAAVAAAGYGVSLIDYSLAVDLRAFREPGQRFASGRGSPAQVEEYCWPPARRGASWRHEMDLYALGVVLYQLAAGTGVPPGGPPTTAARIEPRLPRGWDRLLWADVIARLLEPNEATSPVALARELRASLEARHVRDDASRLLHVLEEHRRLLRPANLKAAALPDSDDESWRRAADDATKRAARTERHERTLPPPDTAPGGDARALGRAEAQEEDKEQEQEKNAEEEKEDAEAEEGAEEVEVDEAEAPRVSPSPPGRAAAKKRPARTQPAVARKAPRRQRGARAASYREPLLGTKMRNKDGQVWTAL